MRTRTLAVALTACLICMGFATQDASAQPHRGGLLPGIRSHNGGPQFGGNKHSGGSGPFGGGIGHGALLQQLAPAFQQHGSHGSSDSRHFGNHDRGGWQGFSGPGFHGRGSGGTPFLDAIRGGTPYGRGWDSYRDYGRGGCGPVYGGYYGYGNGYANAYRDVGIANAAVDLFGTIAMMGTQGYPRYAPVGVPVAAYPAAPVAVYAPPPVVASPAPVAYQAAPRGHYETERTLVSPGHYEEVKVLIPESVDPTTGARIGGYYETRQRWVAEVYEYRPVWVTQ